MIRRMFWLAAVSGVSLAAALPASAHPTSGAKADDCCAMPKGPEAKADADCCAEHESKAMADDCCERPDGMMPGHKKPMSLEHTMNLRYLPVPATVVLGRGMRAQFDNGLSIGGEGNLGLQLFPAAGAGHWLSGYGGVTPGYRVKLGQVALGVEALAGLGWMGRSVGPSETLQGRVIWVAEPRVKLGYQGEKWGLGLTGGYLFTPVMNDLGGVSLGLSLTGKGWGHGHGPHHGAKAKGGEACEDCAP